VSDCPSCCFSQRPFSCAGFADFGSRLHVDFQTTTRWNTYVALAIAGALYGASGLALTRRCDCRDGAGFERDQCNGCSRISLPRKLDARATFGHILRNPLIWSCVIGLALNLSGLPLPNSSLCSGKSSPRFPRARMVLVGAGLEIDDVLKPNAAFSIAAFLKLIFNADFRGRDRTRARFIRPSARRCGHRIQRARGFGDIHSRPRWAATRRWSRAILSFQTLLASRRFRSRSRLRPGCGHEAAMKTAAKTRRFILANSATIVTGTFRSLALVVHALIVRAGP